MEKNAYDALRDTERSWWWRGRSYGVARAIARFAPKGAVLDAGAGYGSMFSVLRTTGPVTAFEPYADAARACETRGYERVVTERSDLAADAGRFALVGAFDVIEHIEDDGQFVRDLSAVLKSGGMLVATVPAFPFLWSAHDVEHHHFRRYTKSTIRAVLEAAGFEVLYASYWNFLLFPVAVALRLAGRGGKDNLLPAPVINRILTAIVWAESRLVPYLSYPAGTGIIVVARKRS